MCMKSIHCWISSRYDNTKVHICGDEFNTMLMAMNQVGIKKYLINDTSSIMHRGVYHTIDNNVYLNKRYMDEPHVLMQLMRHGEG